MYDNYVHNQIIGSVWSTEHTEAVDVDVVKHRDFV
jgi:hypothetical protein